MYFVVPFTTLLAVESAVEILVALVQAAFPIYYSGNLPSVVY
jgi:hypothetical protein